MKEADKAQDNQETSGKEPDIVVEMHMQNLAEAIEDYFVKQGLFIPGDHFETIYFPIDTTMVSPELTFVMAGTVVPSESRFLETSPVDPTRLN